MRLDKLSNHSIIKANFREDIQKFTETNIKMSTTFMNSENR